jgi:hypothetical protein
MSLGESYRNHLQDHSLLMLQSTHVGNLLTSFVVDKLQGSIDLVVEPLRRGDVDRGLVDDLLSWGLSDGLGVEICIRNRIDGSLNKIKRRKSKTKYKLIVNRMK